ncbi:hypothetical protein [Bacillus sp. B15-48]|uniref:hypothetical protein n=1 Tax=Bacillus sp. B15-48 TaxID=1548601 RepID=UPI00193FE5C2|nr:hypothetical protein [Bacillus sp. B15-48]
MVQYKPRVNPFIKAIIFGGFGAFVGLPLLTILDLYKRIDWSLAYSFIILTFMYLLAHWFSLRNSFAEVNSNGDKQ